ncbi:MarC family protein [Williamwhitmania taraxaci]|nr:NAAT family transporter [Williamwhitmania taraxaci]
MGIFEFSLIVFASFFSLINPLGSMPIFMSMTSGLSPKERSKVAIKAVAVSLIILLVFALAGQLIFKFFSISIDSLRIAGGIIFFMMGYDMLQAKVVRVKMDDPAESKAYGNDIAITPLAIPMICGPGAITNAIVLWSDATTPTLKIVLVAVMTAVLGITLLVLLGAGKVVPWIGDTGNKVMMRLMGLLVMVIAVEFFFAGLTPILRRILNIG